MWRRLGALIEAWRRNREEQKAIDEWNLLRCRLWQRRRSYLFRWWAQDKLRPGQGSQGG